MRIGIMIAMIMIGWMSGFADEFSEVEKDVFSIIGDSAADVLLDRKLETSSTIGQFESALVYYRLGVLLSNSDYYDQSIDLLEELVEIEENVYTLTYLGVAYTGKAQHSGVIKQMSYAKKSLKYFNLAVEKDTTHYLPRLYRGMLILFLPGILGGDSDQGEIDLEFVIDRLPELDVQNDFKSFVYLIYAFYWGNKEKDYTRAVKYLNLAESVAENEELLTRIDEMYTEYEK